MNNIAIVADETTVVKLESRSVFETSRGSYNSLRHFFDRVLDLGKGVFLWKGWRVVQILSQSISFEPTGKVVKNKERVLK